MSTVATIALAAPFAFGFIAGFMFCVTGGTRRFEAPHEGTDSP